jgi:DNA invertase Pin-like site-specific DNA recombinase
MTKVMGYIRVSTIRQDADNQRHEILEYTNQNHLHVHEFIEIEISSRKDKKQRRIEELMNMLQPGDILIVSELSRLGRSTSEVIDIVNELIAIGIKFIAIKQGLSISGQHDMQTKVMVTMFSLFAELERDIISERTKAALAAKKASGKKLGKPKGTLQRSKLDPYRNQIIEFLKHGVAKAAIARMLGTSRTNLVNYIKTRGLELSKRE